ncbi:alpha/beta hydrolase [Psychrobacter sp. I-STPA10]|uniref:alpha/beta hydrolase n=1 Tax=Psychrobacter sp. I-STPA10 TaxID=2585769 RepID=UPI001E4A77A9|nr:alpha/beta hydrolase-fold protein [Psychrobacter sp. I-STPA10]
MMTQPSFAKPDLTTPIDMSLLHDPVSGYHFVTQQFSAPAPAATLVAKGDEVYAKPRHYQVWLGIPNSLKSNPSNSQSQPQPHAATSVVYMLDGNGVLDDLDSNQLAAISQASAQSTPPVLVFIGYQTPYRFDVAARAYDYTPPILSKIKETEGQGGTDNLAMAQAFKEQNRERLNGGAEQFYQQLQSKIKPWVNEQLGYTPSQQALWGHSYGGLFVLYTLFHHPEAFNRYYSVDPSLWWQEGEIIKQYQTAKQKLSTQDEMLYLRLTFSDSAVRQANSNSKEDFGNMLCRDWQTINHHNHQQDSTAASKARCSYQVYQQSHGQLFNTGLLDMLSDF